MLFAASKDSIHKHERIEPQKDAYQSVSSLLVDSFARNILEVFVGADVASTAFRRGRFSGSCGFSSLPNLFLEELFLISYWI